MGELQHPTRSGTSDPVPRTTRVVLFQLRAQKRQPSLNPAQPILLYLFQVHSDCFTILNEPGALLHLDLIEELPINDWRVALEAHPEPASLDVHHHVLALQPEAHLEGHSQLQQKGADLRSWAGKFLPTLPCCCPKPFCLGFPRARQSRDSFP